MKDSLVFLIVLFLSHSLSAPLFAEDRRGNTQAAQAAANNGAAQQAALANAERALAANLEDQAKQQDQICAS